MPPPIPTVFHCLACGMMWVRPKSWQRTRWGDPVPPERSMATIRLGEHCSPWLTTFCGGAISVLRNPEIADAALAAHRIGGDLAVTELAQAAATRSCCSTD